MKPIDRINSLIDRAVHHSTNDNEARTSALLAVKLIRKHELVITDKEPEIKSSQIDFNINPDDFMQEIPTFNIVINHDHAVCVACNKVIGRGLVIAQNFETNEKTHFECKKYFMR